MPAQRTKAPARERVAPTKSHSLKSSHTHKSAHNTKNMRGDSQRKPGAGVHVSTTMMTAAAATTTTTTGSAPGESLSSSLSGGDVVGGAADSEDPANLSSSFSSSSSRSALPRSGQRCEGGAAAHTGRSTRTASSSTTVDSSVYDTESSLEEEEEEETESSGSWGDSDGGWTTELYGTQFSSSSSSSVSLTSCEEETSSSDTSDSTSPSVKAIGKQWRRRRHHHHHRNGQAQDTASNRKKVATRRDLITTSTATVRHGPRLFCSLPYELFIVVCSFLSVDDYRTLLGVSCDHFYAISCADVLVWRDACLAQWQHKQGFRRFVEDFYHLEAFAKREELAVMGLQQRMIRHEFVCEEVRSERVPTAMRDRDVTQRVTCPAVASERIEQDSAMGADATEEDAASLAHADGSEEGLSSMQPFSRKGLRAAHSHHHHSDLGATCEKTFVDDGEEEEEESVASTGTAPLRRRVRLQERPNSSHRANNGSLSADSHYEHDLDVDGDDPSRHDAEGNHTEEAGTDDDDGMNSTTSGGPRPRRGSAGAHGRIAHRYQHKAASPLPRFLRHVDSLVVEEGHGLDEVGEAGHDETCPELRVVRRTDAVCPCGAFACHEHFKDPSLPNTHNWSHHRSARGEESGNHHPRHGQRHDDDDDDDDGYHEDDEATDKGTRGNRDDGYKGAGEEVEEEDHSDSGGSRTRRYGAKSQHGSRQNHSHAASQKRSNQAGRRRTQKTSAVSSPHPRRRHSRRATHNNNNNTQSDAEQRQRHRRSNSNSNSTHADDDDDVEALLRMLLDPSHHALHDVHHHHVSHRKRGRRQQRRRSHRPKPRKHTNKRKHPHQHSKKDAKMNRAGHHRRRRQQQQQWARLAGEEEADDATQDTHHSGSRITQSRNHNASTAHTSKKNKKKKRRQNSHVQNPKMSKSARRRRRHHQSRLSRDGGAIHAGEEGVEGEDDCGAAGRMASSQSYPRRRRRGVQDDSEGSRTDTNTSTNTSSSSSNTGVTGGSRTVLYDRHGDGSHSSTNSDDVIALSPTATYQAIKSAIPMHGAQQLAPLPMSSRAALAASSSAAAPGSVGGAALVEQLPATASPHAAGPTVRTPQTLRLPSSPPMTAATAAHAPHLISQGPLPPHHVPGCPLEAQTRAVLSASSATRPPPPPPPPPPAGAADAAGLYWWQMNPDERQRQLRRQQRHEQEEQHRSRRQHEQSRRRGRPGRGRGVHPAVACPCGATLLSTAGAARGDQARLTHSAHSTTTSTMGYEEEGDDDDDDAGSESGVGHDSGQGRRRVSSSSSSSTGHGERGSTLTYSPQSSPQQKPPRSRTRTHAEEEELAQWDAFDEEVFQHRQRVLAATAAGVEERKVVLPPPPPMTTTAAVLNQHRYAETEFNVRSGQPVARRGGGDVKEESPFVSAASSSASHSDESCEEQASHRDDCDVEGRSSHLSRHNDCGDLRSNDEDDDTTITGAASPTKRVRFNLAKAHSATTSVAPLTSVTIVELQRALAHDGLSPLENKLAMRRHTTAADGAGGELKTMLPGLHDDDARAQVLGPAAHEDTTTNTLSVRAVAISSSTLASGSAGRSRGAGGEQRRRRHQHRPQQQQQQQQQEQQQQQQRRRRRSDMAGTSQRAQPPSPPVEALSGSGSIHVATPTQRGRAAGGGARASAHCRANNNKSGCGGGGGGDSHKRLMRRPLPMPNPYKELEEAMRITRAKSQLIQALHKNTRVAANVATDRFLPPQQHLLHPTRGAHEREERLTVGHGVHRDVAEAPLARDQSMSATNSSTPGTGSPSEPHTHASADGAQHLRGSVPTSVQARVPALLTPLRLPRDGSSLSLPSLSSPATAPAVYTASAIAFAAAADLEMGSGAGSGGGGVNPFVVTPMATPTAATTTTTGMELCQRTVSSGQPRTGVEDVDDDTLEPVSWKFAYYMSRREAHRSLVTMQDLVEGTWYACFRATGHVHPVVFSWAKTIQVQPAISLGALAAPGESARPSGTASTADVTRMASSSAPLSGASTLQARTSATTPDTTAAPTTTAQQQQQQQQQQQRAMPPLTYHLLQGGAQLVVQSFPVLQIKRRTGTNSANGITTATTATPSLPASAAASSSSSAAAAAAFTLEPQRTLRRLHAMETHGQRGETLSTAGVEASTDTTRDVQASGVSGAAVPKDDTGSTGSVGVAESTYDPDDDWGWTMRNQFVVIFSVDVQAPFYVRKLHRLGGAQ